MVSEKKKLKRFKALFDRGIALMDQGRHREGADTLMEAVLAAPSVWTKYRFTAFQTFCQSKRGALTENDVKLLKRFLHNTEEPAVYRAQAAALVASGTVQLEGNVHDAAEYYRLGLDCINSSPAEHDDKVIIFPPYARNPDVTVKRFLRKMKLTLEANVGYTEGNYPSMDTVETLKSMGVQTSFKMQCVGLKNEEEDLMKRTQAGGTHCDCCNKSTKELQMEELLKCGRCQMVFYCSTDCQRKAWNGGHKQACRKKGQVKVGDDMQLGGLANRKDLNGRFVKVVGAGAVEGKWLVKLAESPNSFSVSVDKLIRLRPTA
jgi:uncharacterized C2H2 Zn-finger protein